MPPTHAMNLFLHMVQAVRSGIPMTPRSANDKEYFAQDWFADRLNELSLPYRQQGRNSYPDFIVGGADLTEGYEIKSLAFVNRRPTRKNMSPGFVNRRPARKNIDFNSTIPSGRKDNREVFLVFFLYTGKRENPRRVQSFSLAHADFINADHALADEHLNVKILNFGSYAVLLQEVPVICYKQANEIAL